MLTSLTILLRTSALFRLLQLIVAGQGALQLKSVKREGGVGLDLEFF